MSSNIQVEKPADFREIFRKLSYILSRREKVMAGVIFVLLGIGAALEMVGVGVIPLFVGLLSRPEVVMGHPLGIRFMEALDITTKQELVLWAALGLVVLFTLKNAYVGFLAYVRARYSLNREANVGRRLLGAYLGSPYTFHLQRNSAELLRNINTETGKFVSKVLMALLQLVMEGLILVFIFGLLIAVEPVISVLTGLVLGTISLVFYWAVRKRVAELGKREQGYNREVVKAIQQGLGGVKETKVLNREAYFLDTFAVHNDGRVGVLRVLTVLNELPRLVLETFAVCGMLLIAVLLMAQGREIAAIVPTMTLLGVATVRLLPSFNRLINAVTSLRWGQFSLNVIYDDLKLLEQRADVPSRTDVDLLPFDESIQFRSVSYRYPGAEGAAIKDITFDIPRGNAVAFVGPSGSGKTTVVDVLLGLLPPTEGAVCVDDVDVYDDLSRWQRQIGYIPQTIYLTDDTITRNVAFGLADEEIDPVRVREALEAAQLWDIIETLPEGVDTPVGEHGVRLSGGQRQRIGIARALYYNPSVLVMDEATSALDNQTERFIVEALESLRGERTLIIIAHRLSTVRNCDRLFFLKDGRLTDSGTYDELLELSDEFRVMAV